MEEQPEATERAKKLAGDVQELLPELKPDVVRAVISPVFEQACGLTQEVEGHFRTDKRQLDANAVVAVMVQGALAVICEGHQDDDIRGRLYRAGRLVGDFITEQWSAKIQRELDERRKATES